MSSELDALLSDYDATRLREGVTHLELVILEHKIWDQLKLDHGTGLTKRPEVGERRDWFVKRFGGQSSTYDNRFTIYKAGSWAHPLFDLVEKGVMSLGTAKNIVGQAKRITKRKQISPADALKAALENNGDYEGDDELDQTSNPLPAASGSLRSFHRTVTLLAEQHLEESFSEIHADDYFKRTLLDDFRDSLDLLIREFGQKINRVKAEAKLSSRRAAGAAQFELACEALGLKYKWGDQVDMRIAKQRKNKRSLELHPDRNPDNPQAARELERVLNAYEILEIYSGRHRSAHGKIT